MLNLDSKGDHSIPNNLNIMQKRLSEGGMIMEKLDNIVMYSPEDVRKLLHLGNTKCLELFNSEDFPSIKIGRAFWVKADCLERFLSEKHVVGNKNEDLF